MAHSTSPVINHQSKMSHMSPHKPKKGLQRSERTLRYRTSGNINKYLSRAGCKESLINWPVVSGNALEVSLLWHRRFSEITANAPTEGLSKTQKIKVEA